MSSKRISFSQFYIVPVLFIVGLITLVLCVYFFVQYQRTQVLLNRPSELVKQQGDEILQIISPVIHISQNETPTIATVADKNKLTSQPFFERAENGDKVLIFRSSNTVVLYRPTLKKVIAVSAIPKEQQSIAQTVTQSDQKQVRVAVLNGSQVNGLAKKTAERLTQEFKNITIVKEETAEKKTYSKAQIVFITPQGKQVAEQIAQLLDGDVTPALPDGESSYDADIVIIATQ